MWAAPALPRCLSTKASAEKSLVHYTSYGFAVGIPAALFIGEPFVGIVDYGLAVAVPLHSYIGMRSILIDYVPDDAGKKVAAGAAGLLAFATAGALIKFNLCDVGITEGFKSLWRADKE